MKIKTFEVKLRTGKTTQVEAAGFMPSGGFITFFDENEHNILSLPSDEVRGVKRV